MRAQTMVATDAELTPDAAEDSAQTPPERDESASLWWWVRTIGSWLLLLVLGFVLLALVVVPRVSGAQPYTVLTGSMEPSIAPGALVVVRQVPAEELNAGDVITFQPYSGNPAVVTHRITGIYQDMSGQTRIYTQGDANNTPDDWALVPEQVRGTLWYSVPQLGRVNVLLTGEARPIAITVVAGGLLVYAAWMVGSGLRDRGRGRRAADADAAEAAPSSQDQQKEAVDARS
ncbi:signal peptidase I [Rhodococcus sp. IEGM 1408]|uniref:signal peptidase I n=1 Tax=Rhodococcus sp. IEGM 1408 TaxID=3082220 RepID=UPI002955C946|nr:signal peptidase I [Rhodococcus sp. IEGM 1408]MDV8002472.1 signal peptidase I [Rhodococcus sp. IEGM 1408]